MVRDRVAHRRRRHLGDHDAQPVEMGVDGAGRAHERDVAVVASVRRVDGAGEPVVGAAGEEVALDLRAARVGGDDRDRGVGAGLEGVTLERRLLGEAGSVGGARDATIGVPSASDTSPTALTTTSAPTTTSPSRAEALPIPPVLPCSPPRHLATLAPLPAPTRPVASSDAGGSNAAAERGASLVGPRALVTRDHQVEDRGGGHDGHRAATRREPATLLRERAHHAVGAGQAERGAAGEHHRVDVLDRGQWIEDRGLAGGRRAPRISTDADRVGREDDHGDTGGVPVQCAGQDPRDVGDHVSPRRRGRRPGRPRGRAGTRGRTR